MNFDDDLVGTGGGGARQGFAPVNYNGLKNNANPAKVLEDTSKWKEDPALNFPDELLSTKSDSEYMDWVEIEIKVREGSKEIKKDWKML